jgi:iron complex outermembrane receptor protein
MHNTKYFYIGLLCLFFTSNVFSQTTIKGKILDEQGESLLGANVIINGTSQGTVSDQNGNFNLTTSKDIPFGIEVSFIGFGSQNITVNAEQLGTITLVVENSFDEVIISASNEEFLNLQLLRGRGRAILSMTLFLGIPRNLF